MSARPVTDTKREYFVSAAPLTVLVRSFCVKRDYLNGFVCPSICQSIGAKRGSFVSATPSSFSSTILCQKTIKMGLSVHPPVGAKRGYFLSATPLTVLV